MINAQTLIISKTRVRAEARLFMICARYTVYMDSIASRLVVTREFTVTGRMISGTARLLMRAPITYVGSLKRLPSIGSAINAQILNSSSVVRLNPVKTVM
jgi:hypothetical protein